MARKNLLKGLMDDARGDTPATDPPAPDGARVNPAKPRYNSGAIGAVSQSIAELKSRSVVEIPPDLIERAGLHDRMGEPEEDHQKLVASIREYGQQVPVLLRPNADKPGHFEIVYGRRRVLALRTLGQPVKALIRDLDDQALVMAQGQENSARRDLSFIEKCNFARQLRDGNFKRKQICDALSIDKTLVSRMLSVADRIPVELIEAIGPAPGIGRDRWIAFADAFETNPEDTDFLIDMMTVNAASDASDDRFDAMFTALAFGPRAKPERSPSAPRAPSQVLHSDNGIEIGRVTKRSDAYVFTLPREGNGGFEDWLSNNLSEIHRSWVQSRRGE